MALHGCETHIQTSISDVDGAVRRRRAMNGARAHGDTFSNALPSLIFRVSGFAAPGLARSAPEHLVDFREVRILPALLSA